MHVFFALYVELKLVVKEYMIDKRYNLSLLQSCHPLTSVNIPLWLKPSI